MKSFDTFTIGKVPNYTKWIMNVTHTPTQSTQRHRHRHIQQHRNHHRRHSPSVTRVAMTMTFFWMREYKSACTRYTIVLYLWPFSDLFTYRQQAERKEWRWEREREKFGVQTNSIEIIFGRSVCLSNSPSFSLSLSLAFLHDVCLLYYNYLL